MTAPALSSRGTPAGIRLEDGFQTKLSFANNPTLEVWERSVKPPGIDGGDPLHQTTMHNVAVHTFSPRSLIKYEPITMACSYNPACYTGLRAQVNVRQAMTIRFPDGSTLTFYGFLQKFEPSDLKEGEVPEATLTICVTNWDPVARVEVQPVYVDVVGT